MTSYFAFSTWLLVVVIIFVIALSDRSLPAIHESIHEIQTVIAEPTVTP